MLLLKLSKKLIKYKKKINFKNEIFNIEIDRIVPQ